MQVLLHREAVLKRCYPTRTVSLRLIIAAPIETASLIERVFADSLGHPNSLHRRLYGQWLQNRTATAEQATLE